MDSYVSISKFKELSKIITYIFFIKFDKIIPKRQQKKQLQKNQKKLSCKGVRGPVVQFGQNAALSRRRLRVRVSSGSPLFIMMSSQITLILLNLTIAGIIFCHLFLTTPIIFKTLDEDSASRFLRAIFPRYYALIFLLSIPATLILYFQDSQLSWWIGFNISAHALLGLIGIPITNAAKDRGWETIFSFSHGFSVYCTIVIFVLSIIQFFINFD